jgi:hypothetical protein
MWRRISVNWPPNCSATQSAVELRICTASWEARTDIGSRVRFSAHNVFLANQEEAANLASGDEEFEGMIVGFSDSGALVKAYAVVEVARKLSFVVPVQDLRLVPDSEPNAVELGS